MVELINIIETPHSQTTDNAVKNIRKLKHYKEVAIKKLKQWK